METAEVRRGSRRDPGYDCRVTCEHEEKGDHGISGGVWWYWVSDGERAVSLMVLTNDYPPSVERPLPLALVEMCEGVLGYHTADPEGRECSMLADGARCRSDESYIGGQSFWKKHGSPAQFEQPESFWAALEEELRRFQSGQVGPLFGDMLDFLRAALSGPAAAAEKPS